MNIIFDETAAIELSKKYTVLELDTILQSGMTKPIKLHALVEINNITELSSLNFFKSMHEDMINAYKSGDWESTITFAQSLIGQFNGELDSFYENILDFCQESAKVNKEWDGIRHTTPKE